MLLSPGSSYGNGGPRTGSPGTTIRRCGSHLWRTSSTTRTTHATVVSATANLGAIYAVSLVQIQIQILLELGGITGININKDSKKGSKRWSRKGTARHWGRSLWFCSIQLPVSFFSFHLLRGTPLISPVRSHMHDSMRQ